MNNQYVVFSYLLDGGRTRSAEVWCRHGKDVGWCPIRKADGQNASAKVEVLTSDDACRVRDNSKLHNRDREVVIMPLVGTPK